MIPLLIAWPLACAGAVVVWARIAARLNRTPTREGCRPFCPCGNGDEDAPDTDITDTRFEGLI